MAILPPTSASRPLQKDNQSVVFAEILKMFLGNYAEILKMFLAVFAEILKMFGFEHRFNGLFMLHQYPPPAQTWCAAYLRFVHPIQRRFWKDLWFSMVLLLFYCI